MDVNAIASKLLLFNVHERCGRPPAAGDEGAQVHAELGVRGGHPRLALGADRFRITRVPRGHFRHHFRGRCLHLGMELMIWVKSPNVQPN